MSRLIVLVGLPGSGKSTLEQKLKIKYKAEIISSDALRKELCGTELDQNHNSEVFAEMQKRTIDLLKSNKSVIYDATNINSKKRKVIAYPDLLLVKNDQITLLLNYYHHHHMERQIKKNK